jgi:hypothetical protein
VWYKTAMPYVLTVTPRVVWRLLPGSSLRVGPPRRWTTWTEYAKKHPTQWTEILPAAEGELPAPFWPRDGRMPFKKGCSYQWPAQGIAFLKRVRVVSSDGWLVSGNDCFLGDFTMDGNKRTSPVYALLRQRSPIYLPGRTLNLCSQYARVNYCHWLIDAVARLELLHRKGSLQSQFDHILLPRFKGVAAEWIMARTGLISDRILHPDVRDQFECETLVQPSYPGSAETYPSWPIEFYRRHFPAQRKPGERRIYIPRRGNRRIENEAEVEEQLRRLGFETFEPEGKIDLHQTFSDVTHVVGTHGAAMANLVFCQPGTRVLELLPSDMLVRYYYSLCSSGQMPYGVVVGTSAKERRIPVPKATNAPFVIPTRELSSALDALLTETAK